MGAPESQRMETTTVGQQLHAARTRQRLTLKEVTRVTKIQPWVLEALERDQLHTSMSPVYVKSFLSTYAKLLELDPKPLVAQLFPPPAPPEPPPQLSAKQVTTPRPATAARPVAASPRASWVRPLMRIAAGTARRLVVVLRGVATLVRIGALSVLRALAWMVGRLVPLILPRLKPLALGFGVIALLVVVKPWRRVAPQTPSKQASVSVVPEKPAKPREMTLDLQPSQPLELVVTARRPTWVSVKADGRLLAQQQLEPGAKESWQALRRFELIVARPAYVEVSLNGQPISPLLMAHRGRLEISHAKIVPLPDKPIAPIASQKSSE